MTNNKNTEKMTIQLDLPSELEKQLDYLVKISGKSKEFIITEALIRYVEDMTDIQKYSVLQALGEFDKIKKQKTYTSEEREKKLRT